MNNHNRKTFRFNFTLKHLFLVTYVLVFLTLLCLLYLEKNKQSAPLSLDSGTIDKSIKGKAHLTLAGDGLSNNLRGLYSGSMYTKPPLQWKVLSGISVRSVDIDDELALVACLEKKLISINLSKQARPELVSSLKMPQPIKLVKLVGRKAIVGMANGGGLAIVSVDGRGSLKMVAHYPMEGSINEMVVSGSRVYYLNYGLGLGMVNFDNKRPEPETLVELKKPWKMSVADGRLAVADIGGNILLFDLQPDGGVVKSGQTSIQGADRGGIRGVEITDTSLIVVLRGRILKAFSLRDWPRSKRFSELELPGEPYQLIKIPGRESLLISMIAAGLAKVDILFSGEVILKAHMMLPTTFWALNVNRDTVFASGQPGYEGLHAYNLAELEKTFTDLVEPVGKNYHSLLSWNDQLYGYHREENLEELQLEGVASTSSYGRYLVVNDHRSAGIYELDRNLQPLRLGSILINDSILGAFEDAGIWYVLGTEGIRIFKGVQPEEIVPVANMEISGQANCMRLFNSDVLLVATRDEGLKIIDVADPAAPRLIAEVSFPTHLNIRTIARQILVDGNNIYVSQGRDGVYVINVSELKKPVLTQIIDTHGRARGMVLREDIIYVANGEAGVFLIDVSNSSRAMPIGSVPTPLSAMDIAIVGNGLIVNAYPTGALQLPLPQRIEKLKLLDDQRMQGEIADVESQGYAFLYDDFRNSRVLVRN